MSYRPTIAVFIEGRIADIGYYRNWDDNDLFFEALYTAMRYMYCASRDEYMIAKYGVRDVVLVLEPEIFEMNDENLAFLAGCSEFPIAVDLTNKCIYKSERPLCAEELERIPSVFEHYGEGGARISANDDLGALISRYRIPFAGLDRDEILALLNERDVELKRAHG